ncbi:VanW family protein [Adlercreutzia sp. ZJ138]|uniref:VanW family protein n=1 Tax=Adlercreutzia sp. ZJ138 TaxID=2709405 RepID=UPI0013EB5D78|nr:VanW family protein [Adlercreutzia sp. ZJ138]
MQGTNQTTRRPRGAWSRRTESAYNLSSERRGSHSAEHDFQRSSQDASTRVRSERSVAHMHFPREHRNRAAARRKAEYAQPTRGVALWTKGEPRATSRMGAASRVIGVLKALAHGIVSLVAVAAKAACAGVVALAHRSKIAAVVLVLVCAVALLGAGDALVHLGRAYGGVSVGGIDVSGMTQDEIASMLDETYADTVSQGQVSIYASDEAQQRVNDAAVSAQDAALAEQLAVEEARENKQMWMATSSSLSASVPAHSLAQAALAVGRDDGGIIGRLGARLLGHDIPFLLEFNEEELEGLALDIDKTIGTPRVDFNIAVDGGVASVSPGNDGNIIDRDDLRQRLTNAFAGTNGGETSFVAEVSYAPVRIDEKEAQKACDTVNAAIEHGATVSCEGTTWEVSRADLGEWVSARPVEKREGHWELLPCFDADVVKPAILQNIEMDQEGGSITVSFSTSEDGEVSVAAQGVAKIPLVAQTVSAMNEVVFGEASRAAAAEEEGDVAPDAASMVSAEEGQPIKVSVATGEMPSSMTFDEALDYGIIELVSLYTTEYTSGAGTENRNHNIHLAADLISDSVAKAGGTWSFIENVGECDESQGFASAGAIVGDEYTDEIGGGVCQVATTVFNAVYEAGYPVLERRNHSLYIASYQAGRDAAVAWPDLDLVWENDSDSDVLLRASYTETSITVSLYGIDPGYEVTSEDGVWEEGEKYITRVVINDQLDPSTVFLKSSGADGSSFWVTRTVTNAAGEVLHVDRFDSVYQPKNEVYEAGSQEAAQSVTLRQNVMSESEG